MNEINIYNYIENYNLHEETFFNFVTHLCKYFSSKFGVRECPIKIQELKPNAAVFGKIPPAEYCYDELPKNETGNTTYGRCNESIKFSLECSKETNKARIVKLAAHEWMHFYNALFKWEQLDSDEIKEEYKDLIIKSIHYNRDIWAKLKEKYDNKIYGCLKKLSVSEVVADKHALSFLEELYNNINDVNLKQQIQKQIENHNVQVSNYRKFLEHCNINEDCIVK